LVIGFVCPEIIIKGDNGNIHAAVTSFQLYGFKVFELVGEATKKLSTLTNVRVLPFPLSL
jgi:hypothetical protein